MQIRKLGSGKQAVSPSSRPPSSGCFLVGPSPVPRPSPVRRDQGGIPAEGPALWPPGSQPSPQNSVQRVPPCTQPQATRGHSPGPPAHLTLWDSECELLKKPKRCPPGSCSGGFEPHAGPGRVVQLDFWVCLLNEVHLETDSGCMRLRLSRVLPQRWNFPGHWESRV